MLRLQERGTLIDHKLNNYDWKYKGPIPQIGCQDNGGYRYEPDVIDGY
jgi:hypothetical protein